MESLEPILCISTFILIVLAAIGSTIAAGKRRSRVWQQLATRYGGSCTPGGPFGSPSVRFTYADTSVLVDTCGTGDNKSHVFTQIHFYWPDKQFRLEVYPEGVFARIRKFFGMEDIQIGVADFDPKYIISGNSRQEVGTFLSPHVRQAIRQAQSSGTTDDIHVSLAGGHFLVKKQCPIGKYDELHAFIDVALRLYEQALLTRAAGITFVEQGAAFSLDEAICRICGEPVTKNAAVCRRCKTPHHRECWQYYGACSTYGCGETKYLVAKKKPARDTKPASQ